MNKLFVKDAFGWGFALWLFGYILGIVLFFVVPANMIGWVIMPFGWLVTLLVVFKKIKGVSVVYYLGVAVVWTLIAIVGDYLFIVKAFKPVDGYYKTDVYIYYISTFIIPIIGWWRNKTGSQPK